MPYRYCSSASLDADLWRPVKKLLEGRAHLYGFRRVRAHRSRTAAATEGDLAIQDWEGNDGADVLAKLLARICAAEKATDATAVQEGDHGTVLRRLAAAMGWTLRNWPANDPKKKKKGRQTWREEGGTGVGDHLVRERRLGGVICTRCHLYAATPTSLKTLKQSPCRGSIGSQCHPSHRTRFLTGITWCCRCGAYASKRPRALKLPCRGAAPTEARRNVLRRLRAGLMPTTAHYLAGVVMDADDEANAAARLPIQDLGAACSTTASRAQSSTVSQEPPSLHAASGEAAAAASCHEMLRDACSSGGEQLHETARGVKGTDDVLQSAAEFPQARAAHGPVHSTSTSEAAGSADIRVETTISPGALASGATSPSDSSFCRPGAETHWTRRLQHQRAAVAGRCGICQELTRTLCKGCSRPTCFQCAKVKRHCNGVG